MIAFSRSALQKTKHGLRDGDWWGAEVEVPATAAVLDFVLSDGAQVDSNLAICAARAQLAPYSVGSQQGPHYSCIMGHDHGSS